MLHAHADHGRCNMKNEEICWMLYTIIHKLALLRSTAWHTWCEYTLYHLYVQPVQELQPHDKHLNLQYTQWVLYKILDILFNFCTIYCGLTRQYLHKEVFIKLFFSAQTCFLMKDCLICTFRIIFHLGKYSSIN
jgi:hypothetical protein